MERSWTPRPPAPPWVGWRSPTPPDQGGNATNLSRCASLPSGFTFTVCYGKMWYMGIEEKRAVLSQRELEVIRLVATGATNRQIASSLDISPNTVKVHLRNIFEKLGVESRTEATLHAIQEGWVEIEGMAPAAEEVTVPPQETAPTASLEGTAPAAAPRRHLDRRLLVAAVILALLAILVITTQTGGGIGESSASATRTAVVTETGAPLSKWASRSPLPMAASGLALVAQSGVLYAIGGQSVSGVTGAVRTYDPRLDRWAREADKPTPVRDVAAAVIGGLIYVPGGCDASGQALAIMEAYDPEEDAWQRRTPLPEAVCGYALAALEGKLYVFGGWDGTGYLAAAQEYDPGLDRWMLKTAMPTPRGYAAAAEVEGQIYVVGGYDGQVDLAVNEVYEPSKDNAGQTPWTVQTPLPSGRGGLGMTVLAGSLYVFGGGWEERAPTVAHYSVRDDVWTEVNAPPEARGRNLGVATMGTKIYIIGGWDGDYLARNEAFTALYQIFLPPPGR